MFNAKASAVRNLMVAGKLLTLLATSPALANELENPRFFEYRSSGFVNQIVTLTFGWFKTLDEDQKSAYDQSLYHAVMSAENGEKVSWYRNDASGYAVPVMTWPTGSGYCRRMHIQAIAYGMEKTMTATACYDNAHDNWRWVSSK
jgi:surface antigen